MMQVDLTDFQENLHTPAIKAVLALGEKYRYRDIHVDFQTRHAIMAEMCGPDNAPEKCVKIKGKQEPVWDNLAFGIEMANAFTCPAVIRTGMHLHIISFEEAQKAITENTVPRLVQNLIRSLGPQ